MLHLGYTTPFLQGPGVVSHPLAFGKGGPGVRPLTGLGTLLDLAGSPSLWGAGGLNGNRPLDREAPCRFDSSLTARQGGGDKPPPPRLLSQPLICPQ